VPRHVARLVTRLVVDYFDYATRPGPSARRVARPRLLRLRRASGCLGTSCGSSPGSSSTTSTMPRVQVPWHVAQLVKRLVAPLVVDYSAYAMRPGASARRAARHPARHRLLHLRRTSGCLGTSSGLSRDSSSTTSPLAGSSSTTSRTLSVRVPRHIVRLVTRLIVDYFDYAARPGASARRAAVVDYFDYTAHPGASARCAARRRLLRLRRASWCLNTSCSLSPGSSSTTARHANCRATHRRLLRLA
jgi:hypothetical protein